MAVLANPRDSQLLLIDPVPECFTRLNRTIQTSLKEQFGRLSAAADRALVPRYFAVSGEDEKRETWLSAPCSRGRRRVFHFDRKRAVWASENLLNSMRAEQREQLFICGFWLDDVVSAAALEAPTFGFNTHIVIDLSPVCDRRYHRVRLDRLNQYTIAPVSLRNLLYEWMTKTEDDVSRSDLELLWKEQIAFESRATSQ